MHRAQIKGNNAEKEINLEVLLETKRLNAQKVRLIILDRSTVKETQGQDQASVIDETVQKRHHNEKDLHLTVIKVTERKDENL